MRQRIVVLEKSHFPFLPIILYILPDNVILIKSFYRSHRIFSRNESPSIRTKDKHSYNFNGNIHISNVDIISSRLI